MTTIDCDLPELTEKFHGVVAVDKKRRCTRQPLALLGPLVTLIFHEKWHVTTKNGDIPELIKWNPIGGRMAHISLFDSHHPQNTRSKCGFFKKS